CIDSILAQTFTDMELILVNDGSTDDSGKICNEYARKDKRVQVINKQNSGVSDTRNRGLKEAKGKYILFIDGDDYWEGNILGEIEKIIYRNDEPDLIFTNKEYRLPSNGGAIEFTCGFNEDDFNSLNGHETLKYLLTSTDKK